MPHFCKVSSLPLNGNVNRVTDIGVPKILMQLKFHCMTDLESDVQ